MSLIHVNNLTKHFKVLNRREGLGGAFRDLFSGDYRTVKAVDGISFDIEAGEIVGYIGPNGAGKSTTIKMMTGILKPSGGEILINSHVPFENRIQVSIFDGTFRFTFTYILPIGFIACYPSQIFLRPEEVSYLTYFSPVIGIGLFALTYRAWTKLVNGYSGTGS